MEPDNNAERTVVVRSSDPTCALVQPSRMDVLIHLLALEEAAGIRTVDIDLTDGERTSTGSSGAGVARSPRADEFFAKAHQVDWTARSEALTTLDGEPPIGERLTGLTEHSELVVRFAPGGQLVGGASNAALGLFEGRHITRQLGTSRPIDRSINGLRVDGWSHGDLRALIHKWAVFDPKSAIVLLRVTDDNFANAHHEITCRYDLIHSEYDLISKTDQLELEAAGRGSVQSMFIRAEPGSLEAVVARHGSAVAASFVGDFSVVPISVLWSPMRQSGTDTDHEQRLRKIRRKELTSQLLDKARGR